MSAAPGAAGSQVWPAFAFASLVFLAIPVSDLVRTGSPAAIAGSAACLAALLIVHGWFWLRVRTRPEAPGGALALAALVILTSALVLAAPDRWWFLPIYVVVVAGALSPARRAVSAVAGVVLLVVALSWLVGQNIAFTFAAAAWIGLCGAICVAITELIGANVQLRAARAEIGRLAVSEERLRFARDLHDVLGHSLSLIVIKAGLSARLAAAGDGRARGEMEDVESVALDALQQVREVVAAYRTPCLAEELHASRRLLDVAGIRCVLRGRIEAPAAVDSALAWAVREGVTNVVRHSGGTSCLIDVRRLPDAVRLEIADNGRGGAAAEGNGLHGLRERLEGLRGELTACGSPAGFVLTVSIPVDAAAAVAS